MNDKHTTSRPPGLQLAKRSLSFLNFTKRAFSNRHKCVVVASMPKSSSTFLTKTFSQLPGFREVWPVHKGGRIEQNLYPPSLIDIYGATTVSQIHLRATEANVALIKKFEVKPVVLVRDIFDTVVSWYDHMENESPVGCMFYATDRYFKLSEEERMNMIVDLAIPWYFSFYVSWVEAEAAGAVNPLWLTYTDVTKDTRNSIRRITDFADIQCSDAEIEKCMPAESSKSSEKVRFNKGVSGRGLSTLSSEQIERIKTFASYYPGIDFSKIGIST